MYLKFVKLFKMQNNETLNIFLLKRNLIFTVDLVIWERKQTTLKQTKHIQELINKLKYELKHNTRLIMISIQLRQCKNIRNNDAIQLPVTIKK